MSCVSDLVKQKLALGRHIRIKLLGDSITHGVGGTGFEMDGEEICCGVRRNPNGYCWAKTFKEYMEEKYDCTVVNNGIGGITIEFIIEHFDELVDEQDDLTSTMQMVPNVLMNSIPEGFMILFSGFTAC